MRFFIELSYRGTNYHGWQVQPNADTVQFRLEEALSTILRKKVSLTGAGRTDTGVHASYFTAHFDEEKAMTEYFIRRLNGFLPHDIRVFRICRVPDNAHARFDALSRTYRYLIVPEKHPFTKNLTAFIPGKQDLALLNEASSYLLSCKDFAAFSKLHSNNKTTICRIDYVSWVRYREFLIFTITADRFLRNMVRSLVGTLLEAGRGKISLQEFREIVLSRDRSNAGTSAPAEGLYLTDIRYPENYGLNNPGKDELLPFAW